MMATEQNAMMPAADQLRGELARRQQQVMMVAHEMRNLLAPLAYSVELLARADATTALKARPVIGRQVAQMRRLVDDLLDVVCSEQGRMSLAIASVDLREVIAAAIDMARPAIAAREQHLTLNDQAMDPTIIEGDPGRLTQVLSNLLLNAAKFTPPGGDIRVALECEASCLNVWVCDTGIGIAPDMLSRIFDVYVRAARAPDSSLGGLGLGLTVARNLVESHGGTLCAYSAGPGKGSEFVMRLPISR